MRPARRTVLAVALALSALLTSCGTAEPEGAPVPDDWTTHTVGDVTFSAPGDWETDGADGTLLVRRGTDASDAMASVVLVPEPRPLQAEADAVLASMVAAIGAEKTADGPVEKTGAREALQLEYVGEQPLADGAQRVTVRSRWLFMLLEDGSGVIAAVSAPEDEFDEDVETVLDSVTLP